MSKTTQEQSFVEYYELSIEPKVIEEITEQQSLYVDYYQISPQPLTSNSIKTNPAPSKSINLAKIYPILLSSSLLTTFFLVSLVKKSWHQQATNNLPVVEVNQQIF